MAGGLAPGGGDGEGKSIGIVIVADPRTSQQVAAERRLQQAQAQIDEVIALMRTEIDKLLEQEKKLSELDGRAGALLAAARCESLASEFEKQAGKSRSPWYFFWNWFFEE